MYLAFLTPFSEETLATAARIGYSHIEAAGRSWPADVLADDGKRHQAAEQAAALMARHGVGISAIFFGLSPFNTPADTLWQRYHDLFQFCGELGVSIVCTGAGRSERPFEEDLETWKAAFAPVVRDAEEQGIRIGLENWPGMGGYPIKGSNLADTPPHWERLFEAIPSPALGLEFDPSHLVWQGIDYLKALRDFAERIVHFHVKDTEILEDRLKTVGIYGSGWWRYRLPGRGAIDWVKVVDMLREVGYDGALSVEHEDRLYSGDRFNEGLALAHRFLSQIV